MLTYTQDKNNQDILLDSNKNQVMMRWEKPYMEACIDKLQPVGDVLEVGFGMGYSATHIQTYNPKSYTIVECDPVVIKKCKEWAKDYNNVTIIEAQWQTVICTSNLKTYDQVFFDDFPNDTNTSTEIQQVTENNRLYHFLQLLQMYHLNPDSRVSCYLCASESMHKDALWNQKVVNSPTWEYDEDSMTLPVSDLQHYHKSNNLAIIPLLKLVS